MMNELIPVKQNESGSMTFSGRDLYEFLNITERYNSWVERMLKYGFDEGIDFTSVKSFTVVNNGAKREVDDHEMTIDMAKEISMLQRNEKGKQARQYFIEIEKRWNSPEMIVQRALQIQKDKIIKLETENKELKPKASYHDLVLQSTTLITVTQIAKDYGMGAPTLNKILHELGIQYRKGHRWYLYHQHQDKDYTQSKTHVISADETKDHMYWTQKGRLFIYETLKSKKGILPTVERENEKLRLVQ